MRKSVFCTLFAVGLLYAATTEGVNAAQTPPAQQPQTQGQKPKPHDMTGCLAKGDTATTWRLTNVEGGKIKTVDIVETAADLKMAPHLGHKVTITGTAAPAPKATDTKKPAGEHYMRVDAVKMVSATCP